MKTYPHTVTPDGFWRCICGESHWPTDLLCVKCGRFLHDQKREERKANDTQRNPSVK